MIAAITGNDGRHGGFNIVTSGYHIKDWQKGSDADWKPCEIHFVQNAKSCFDKIALGELTIPHALLTCGIMKILHVVPTYLPAHRYGGPIYSVHALCRTLAAIGHDVHVFTTSVDGHRDTDVQHGQPIDLEGVQVHYFRSRLLRRIYYSADLAEALSSTVREFDLLHLHSAFLFPTWAGARSAVRAGVPYLLSPRGMLDKELIARRNAVVKRTWIRFIERRNLARAAAIHVTSEEERRALVELGLALAPTSVIPNGVEVPVSFSPNDVSADVRALVNEGFDILSFGRINWKKGSTD